MEEWDESFRELVGRIQPDNADYNDPEYREALALARASAVLSLEKDKNQVLYLRAISRLHITSSVALAVGTVLAVVWSVRTW